MKEAIIESLKENTVDIDKLTTISKLYNKFTILYKNPSNNNTINDKESGDTISSKNDTNNTPSLKSQIENKNEYLLSQNSVNNDYNLEENNTKIDRTSMIKLDLLTRP